VIATGEGRIGDALPDLEDALTTLALILVRRHQPEGYMEAKGVSRNGASLRALALGGSLLFCGATGFFGCATTESPEMKRLQAKAAHERGLADLKEGRAALGLSALREAAALDPGNDAYHNTLGLLLLDLKRPEALEHFQKAIEIEPRNADAHHNLGVALAEAGRWEAAVAAYRKALAIPTFTAPDVAHHNLGWALLNLDHVQEAEESLRFAIRLNPTLAAAHYTLGLVLVRQARPGDARMAFRRARELDPDSPFGEAAAHHLRALGDEG
jgi:Tfp pilus assembly protein PilF